MEENGRAAPAEQGARVRALVQRLAETQAELQALLGQDIDAVVDPSTGRPLLLPGAQLALGEAEARYRRLTARARVVVFDLGPDGTLLFINDVAAEVTGYRPEELVGQNWWTLFFSQPVQAERWRRRFLAGDVVGEEMALHTRRGEVVLEVTTSNRYGTDGELRVIGGFGLDITERKAAETRIARALHEKSILLRELRHRVANNLQVLISLLQLQARQAPPPASDLLRDAENRVRAMARVHERVTADGEDLVHPDFSAYVRELAVHLGQSWGRPDVAFELDVPVVALSLDQAVACGLILNELVSNALRHAFPPGRRGTVAITLQPAAAHRMTLTVADDGVGLPPNVEPERATTLGLRLVNQLVRLQLQGELRLERGKGTAWHITFGEDDVETER